MMRINGRKKNATITYRVAQAVRTLVEQEAAQSDVSKSHVINAALRQRYAKELAGAEKPGKGAGAP